MDQKMRGLMITSAIGKEASESYQTRDELYSYSRATPKEISLLHAFNPVEWWDSNHSLFMGF
jgi:hypothetical protein